MVINRVRVLGSGPHTPTQFFWEYPSPPGEATGFAVIQKESGLVCTKMAEKRYKAFKTNICSLKEAESEDQWVARTNA